ILYRNQYTSTNCTVSTSPRACLEPPSPGEGSAGVARKGLSKSASIITAHCGDSRLMGLHCRSSHRRPFAIPAGQGQLRQHYIARRKSVCIFEESPSFVPINEVVFQIGISNPANGICETP